MRYTGTTGQLTVRADSGPYAHAVAALCRKMNVRSSITVRQHTRLRQHIEAIPEAEWTPIPYSMEGTAGVAEVEYTPFGSEPDAAPVPLIIRMVKPMPGSQLALFANYSYHGSITDRDGDTLELEADHRPRAEIENAIPDLKYSAGLNYLPSGRFAAVPSLPKGAWLAVQVIDPQPGPLDRTHHSGRAGGASFPCRDSSPARRATSPCTSPRAWPWENQFKGALARLCALSNPS